jgi:hypothetical protein
VTKAVTDEGLPFFYTTKRALPGWAIDAVQMNPYSYVHFSINTSHRAYYKRMSPMAGELDTLWTSVYNLAKRNVFVGIQCNPIIPGVVDLDDIKRVANEAHDNGARHIIFKFVEASGNAAKEMIRRLEAAKLINMGYFKSIFTEYYCGVRTVNEGLRIDWLNELLVHTRSLGLTMSVCHEYFRNSRIQVGPYVTTSDTCHGRGVPLYYRPAKGEQFVPLPGCYRKGCLYCAEYGTQACYNETLLQAKALKYKDLCSIHIEGNEKNWELEESCSKPTDNPNMCYSGNPHTATDDALWND